MMTTRNDKHRLILINREAKREITKIQKHKEKRNTRNKKQETGNRATGIANDGRANEKDELALCAQAII